MNQAEAVKKKIIEEVDHLPESRLQEVLNFVASIKVRREKEEDPILRVAGCLSGSPLTSEDIDKELYGNDPV